MTDDARAYRAGSRGGRRIKPSPADIPVAIGKNAAGDWIDTGREDTPPELVLHFV